MKLSNDKNWAVVILGERLITRAEFEQMDDAQKAQLQNEYVTPLGKEWTGYYVIERKN